MPGSQMLVRELISESALPVSRTDTVGEALSTAVTGEMNHLPVVDEERRLIGMVRLASLLKEENLSRPVGDLPFDAPVSVLEDAHLYEAIQLVVDQGTDVVPVIDAEGKYVGSIGLADVLNPITRLLAVGVRGSIVEVDISSKDFTLRHLIQAVEQTGAKVLSIGTALTDQAGDTIRVVLKTTAEDTSRIRAVIGHLGYRVHRATGRSIQDEEFQHRVAELMHYLDV